MATPAINFSCPKCAGRFMYDRVGLEIDLVCRNCGKREIAVMQLPMARPSNREIERKGRHYGRYF